MTRLYVADPAGSFVPATDREVISAATVAVGRALRRGIAFDKRETARKYLPAMLGAREAEVFCLAHLVYARRSVPVLA